MSCVAKVDADAEDFKPCSKEKKSPKKPKAKAKSTKAAKKETSKGSKKEPKISKKESSKRPEKKPSKSKSKKPAAATKGETEYGKAKKAFAKECLDSLFNCNLAHVHISQFQQVSRSAGSGILKKERKQERKEGRKEEIKKYI